MKKNIIIIMMVLVMVLGMTGCGSDFDTSTQIGSAKLWTQGMIEKDEEILDSLDSGNPLGFPVYFLLDEYSNDFKGYKVDDFEFSLYEDYEDIVVIESKDGSLSYIIEVDYRGNDDQYKFISIIDRKM